MRGRLGALITYIFIRRARGRLIFARSHSSTSPGDFLFPGLIAPLAVTYGPRLPRPSAALASGRPIICAGPPPALRANYAVQPAIDDRAGLKARKLYTARHSIEPNRWRGDVRYNEEHLDVLIIYARQRRTQVEFHFFAVTPSVRKL